ncbi:NOL1/NOP2/sun family putative RNA methylase [bacterium]|nr:NOL1/NOP2/sun family putative RNA methylase [bacterium]NUN45544.1 NOL1/NOP2/sun family putative RNA methylase [bacterium]
MPIEIPEALKEYLKLFPGEYADAFSQGLDFERRTALRVNTLKFNKTDFIHRLAQQNFRFTEIPSMPDALLVEGEDARISKTIEHFLGLFYIQSIASMLPPIVLNPTASDFVLDVSAAPGSKTTQMAQMMKNGGCMVANDRDDKRIKTLSHNLDRLGVINTAMVNMQGERIGNLVPGSFTKVLVDAPCSALGVIHKAPSAVSNLRHLNKFAFIQEQLVVSGLKALRPGGTLVYSTCTISAEENEGLVDTILKRYPSLHLEAFDLPEGIAALPGITAFGEKTFDPRVALTRRVMPSAINPEGFFLAKFRLDEAIEVRTGKTAQAEHKKMYALDGSSHAEICGMGKYFSGLFGFDENFWDQFVYHIKDDETFIASEDWRGRESVLNALFTHRVGMRLARTRKGDMWKLSTNAAQLFSRDISRNIIELTDTREIETFVEAGTIRREFPGMAGGVVVRSQGTALGCGVMHQGALKSQVPKSRTVISVDF